MLFYTNKGNQALTIEAQVSDWEFGPNGEPIVVDPVLKDNSVASWFTFQPTKLTVPPNSTGKVRATVSVPHVASGAAYAYVFLRTVTDAKSSLGFSANMPVKFMINTVTTPPNLMLDVVAIRPPSGHDPLKIELRLENRGTIYAWVEASVDVLGPFDDFVAYLTPDPAAGRRLLLLPNETKTIALEWPGVLAPAAYEAVATAYYGEGLAVVAQRPFEVRLGANEPDTPQKKTTTDEGHLKASSAGSAKKGGGRGRAP